MCDFSYIYVTVKKAKQARPSETRGPSSKCSAGGRFGKSSSSNESSNALHRKISPEIEVSAGHSPLSVTGHAGRNVNPPNLRHTYFTAERSATESHYYYDIDALDVPTNNKTCPGRCGSPGSDARRNPHFTTGGDKLKSSFLLGRGNSVENQAHNDNQVQTSALVLRDLPSTSRHTNRKQRHAFCTVDQDHRHGAKPDRKSHSADDHSGIPAGIFYDSNLQEMTAKVQARKTDRSVKVASKELKIDTQRLHHTYLTTNEITIQRQDITRHSPISLLTALTPPCLNPHSRKHIDLTRIGK